MNRSCQGGTRAKFCFHMVKNLIVECDWSTSKTADTVHTGIKHECLFSKFAAGEVACIHGVLIFMGR